MKITETIKRECCKAADLKMYRGRSLYGSQGWRYLQFCTHCGQVSQKGGWCDPHFHSQKMTVVPVKEKSTSSEKGS